MPVTPHRSAVSPTAPTALDSQAPGDATESTSPLTALSGTLLDGRYTLGDTLGAGGMGAVFEAQDQLLDRPVAIKVIRPAYAERGDYIKRFLREAQAASKVRHRNVVVSLDYGEADGGLLYSVMELLVGQDLKQQLKHSPDGRLPWPQTRDLLVQIASGLKAAHDQGVIHRDIKPANCFVTEEDEQPVVKLVDFGIAKVDDSSEADQITRTSQVLGTPSYIAPELVRTKAAAGPRSDVYSLGVMAYRMLTGHLPFAGETAFEVMYRACTESVPRMRSQVPDLPAGAETLVLEMLAKDPQRRPADMATVRQRLQALVGEPPGRHGTGRLLMLGSGALVAMLGGVGVWSAAHGDEDATDPPTPHGASALETAPTVAKRPEPTTQTEPSLEHAAGPAADEAPGVRPEGERPVEHVPPADSAAPRGAEELTEALPRTPAPSDPATPPSPSAPAKRPRATKGPPSDGVMSKRLRRKIKTKCGDLMQGDRVTVLFYVTQAGETEGPTSMSKNAAGACAIQQVRGLRFRPRDEKTLLKVFAE